MNELDPEMLENLDMLLDMDVIDAQEDWETLSDDLDNKKEDDNE